MDGNLTCDVRPSRYESDSGSDSSASAPATPIEAHATLQSLLYRGVASREEMPNNIIYIDLLRPGASVDVNEPSWTSPTQVAEERSLVERGYKIVRATPHPRHLCDIDPTITLLGNSMINARSHFTVYSEDRVIFSESTTLEPLDSKTSSVDGTLYKTSLVPGFWDTIAKSSGMSLELGVGNLSS
jgi:transcriptional enhancer factor